MPFAAVSLPGCFPELFGFVLLDPARLDHALDGRAAGQNLLELFATSPLGDQVSADGVAIPVLGVDPAYHTVLIRHCQTPSPWPVPSIRSGGWVLGTLTGRLVLCGAGYLTSWDPDHPRHRPITVPPGWYRVEIQAHQLQMMADDDGAFEFVLTPADQPPPFRARLDQHFHLFNPPE